MDQFYNNLNIFRVNVDLAGNRRVSVKFSRRRPNDPTIFPSVMTETKNAVTKIEKSKRHPARVQVDPESVTADDRPPQTGSVFNIWYLKWSGGDREDGALSQTKSQGRCVIARDSGYTKADNIPGSYFCFYFARGLCTNGKNCEYLHRLPTTVDIFSPNFDCFGREKFADYRDDMGGVGSFLRQNRTLYVGRIHVSDNMEEILNRHFSEWGEIERMRVLNNRGVAFITYRNEANAQFAREAMAHQSLDNDEILNVRWAHEDPNPAAKVRNEKRLEEQATEAIKRLLPEYNEDLRKKKLRESRAIEAKEERLLTSAEDHLASAATNESTKTIENGKSHKFSNTSTNHTGGFLSQNSLSELRNLSTGGILKKKKALVSYDSDSDSDGEV